MGRPLRDLRRLEHPGRGSRGTPGAGRCEGQAGAARPDRIRRPARHLPAAAPGANDHRRVRPGAGRRAGTGLRRAGRRRSGDRQIHAPVAGRRRAGRRRAAGAVHLGRGIGRPDPPARPPPRPRWCEAGTGRRHRTRRHPGQLRAVSGRRTGGHRLDPDDVGGGRGFRTRRGEPGAGGGLRADPRRQDPGLRADAGRPRHQGRRVGRSPRARAHGRRGAALRGRPRPPVPHPARREEPLWRHRRDRRVRNDIRGPCPGPEPLGAVPGRAARQCLRQRGVRRHGRLPPIAGGNPGAAVAQPRRVTPPLGHRLGFQPARHADRGAGKPAAG